MIPIALFCFSNMEPWEVIVIPIAVFCLSNMESWEVIHTHLVRKKVVIITVSLLQLQNT